MIFEDPTSHIRRRHVEPAIQLWNAQQPRDGPHRTIVNKSDAPRKKTPSVHLTDTNRLGEGTAITLAVTTLNPLRIFASLRPCGGYTDYFVSTKRK